jgi:hypothetical protein
MFPVNREKPTVGLTVSFRIKENGRARDHRLLERAGQGGQSNQMFPQSLNSISDPAEKIDAATLSAEAEPSG